LELIYTDAIPCIKLLVSKQWGTQSNQWPSLIYFWPPPVSYWKRHWFLCAGVSAYVQGAPI